MAIEWRDHDSLGDSEMDEQHLALFGLVNAFLATTDQSSATEALAHLLHHTRDHFAHEEVIMHRMNYPDKEAHIEQHNTLLSKLQNVADVVANYRLDMAHLESFLSAWLRNHIETVDTKLAGFIQRQ